MSDGPQLSPAAYLYQRAHQIQDELLPRIAAEKEKIQPIADAQLAQLTEMETVLRAEMAVLEAASKVLPPEVVPISEVVDAVGEEGGVE